MQELINILQDLKSGNDREVIAEQLENYIRKNTIVKGAGKFNLFKYISKDDYRLALNGIYCGEGYKVATNSYILVYIKEDYAPELESKVVAKDGSLTNSKFPNWKSVIPSTLKSYEPTNIDFAKIKSSIKQSKLNKKIEKKDKENCLIKIKNLYFKTYLLELFILAAENLGVDKMYLRTDKAVIRNTNNEGCLLMAKTIDDESQFNIIEL